MRSLGYNPSAEELKVRKMLNDKTNINHELIDVNFDYNNVLYAIFFVHSI